MDSFGGALVIRWVHSPDRSVASLEYFLYFSGVNEELTAFIFDFRYAARISCFTIDKVRSIKFSIAILSNYLAIASIGTTKVMI